VTRGRSVAGEAAGAGGPPEGLCASCRHRREVRNTRGSRFTLCRRSVDQPERFARYPRLPVLRCDGWEPPDARGGGRPAEGPPGACL